jgi:hypothetical protein
MLTRVDVDAFQARTSSIVRLLVKSRSNGGVEFATYTYAGTDLDPLDLNAHPGCEFTVRSGRQVLRIVATAGTPQGRYDLFEVLPDNGEVDLDEEIDLAFGPVHQIFIIGASTAKRAAKRAAKKSAARKAARKPGRKKRPAKKAPRKRAPKPAAPRKGPAKKTVSTKTAVTRGGAKKTPSTRKPPKRSGR